MDVRTAAAGPFCMSAFVSLGTIRNRSNRRSATPFIQMAGPRGPHRSTLLASALLIFTAAEAAATGAVSAADGPVHGREGNTLVWVAAKPIIHRYRTDIIRLTQNNRLCVKTLADPFAQAAINASGERMGPSDLQSLSLETAGALSDELRAHGHIAYFPDSDIAQRVLAVEQLVTWNHCDRPAPIRIEQTLLRGPTPFGYKVRFSAKQGSSAYVAEIQRSEVVTLNRQERMPLDERATQRSDGSPFWSARGDLIALRDDFIRYLFRKGLQ